MAFTRQQPFSKKTTDLPDSPTSSNFTASDIKTYIETPSDETKTFVDNHITELEAHTGASNIGADDKNGIKSDVQTELSDLHANKTDLTGDHKGTWQGLNPTQTNQAIQSQVDKNKSDLANNVNHINSQFINVLFPPPPLVSCKGDGVTDDYSSIQGCINHFTGNGGILFCPKPDNTYLIKSPLNLLNTNVISSGTITIIGEAQLNTTVTLDNNASAGALIYDNGTKRIDVNGCSSTVGSNVITTTGNFNTSGLEVGMTVNMSFLPPTATITSIDSDTQITVNKNSSQSVNGSTAMFYKLVTNTHRIVVKDLYVKNTHQNTAFSSWHSGIGLILKGAHDSVFERVRLDGFTKGLYSMGGFINQYNTVNANSCYDGIVLEHACFGANIIKPISASTGDNSGGYPIRIINTGSIKIDNIVIENNKRGVLLEGIHGFDIGGGNIESTSYNYTIETKCMENIDPNDENFWTSGGNIRGFRFYESLGLLVKEGSSNIDFRNNDFVGNPTSFTVSQSSCINSSGDVKYMKNINYGNNRYYPNGSANRHILTGTLSTAQVFTENEKRFSSSIPYYGKYWKSGDLVYNSSPTAGGNIGWVCVSASDGANDGSATWKTFGSIGA